MKALRWVAGALLVVMAGGAPALEVVRERNPDTGLWIYKAEGEGFSIEFIQLHARFIRATYGSKGFTPEMLDQAASFCTFGTIARNLADRPLSYRVADWRAITPDGARHPLKTKTEWLKDWQAAGVPFNWSILPDSPTFQVGDWAQGFTTVKLPRDSTFDLEISWTVGDEQHAGVIEDMECPPERLSRD